MIAYISSNQLSVPTRVKMVLDRDCIPTDVTSIYQFTSTQDNPRDLYWYLYSIARMLENVFKMEVCIDFGIYQGKEWFYETGQDS